MTQFDAERLGKIAQALEVGAIEVMLLSDRIYGNDENREKGLFGIEQHRKLADSMREEALTAKMMGIHSFHKSNERSPQPT